MPHNSAARIYQEEVEILTYDVGLPDKNPLFLERRVYQGSSGEVYPHPVIDTIYDTRQLKKYRAVFLENEYLQIMILPQLGGRVQRALDKTNNYDFVYYNRVIKPALVGLAGPWLSGGIEFNWPQHHRPSTFDPLEYLMQENEDGSVTLFTTEIENMFRTKSLMAFTLRPQRAVLEIKTRLYNRTSLPQTFLWWANPAIAAHDDLQSIFPPDVYAVMDHGKRAVSQFPIARGTYYKVDYSAGVDISRYKNIPVPTSYMVYKSEYDFMGAYDHARQAGVLHVANHHISPGKKQWTWGTSDFGKAWERNLTDEDGPYIELMTGCFTDNQPDFSWIGPYEEKTFTQHFLPYKGIGAVKNASTDAAISVEFTGAKLTCAIYASALFVDAQLRILRDKKIIISEKITISPTQIFSQEYWLNENNPHEAQDFSQVGFDFEVLDAAGRLLLEYSQRPQVPAAIPSAASARALPQDLPTNEELYLAGLHLEQYRHASYHPEDYYREGLRRDPTDSRINTAFGRLLLRRGLFAQSEVYLRAAIAKLTSANPNPYDGEAFFLLGLALKFQERYHEAYAAFYKATWNDAWQASSFYQLACLDCRSSNYPQALEHLERALVRNSHAMQARHLLLIVLRELGRTHEAARYASETLALDPLDFNTRYEAFFLPSAPPAKKDFFNLLGNNHNTALELSIDYAHAFRYTQATQLLVDFIAHTGSTYPLLYYYLAYYAHKNSAADQAKNFLQQAQQCSPYGCFPHRLEDLIVLEQALRESPKDYKAQYYLGNLWYAKKQYPAAIQAWEASTTNNAQFATTFRNLSIAYYNKQGNAPAAIRAMETAFANDPSDARIFMELDQLYKKNNLPPAQRLARLQKNLALVEKRDDCYLELVSLYNLIGEHAQAYSLLSKRKFHPWEGGEGKVPAQYLCCMVALAQEKIKQHDFWGALQQLEAARLYPPNLGEGKLFGVQENNIFYFMGLCYEGLGQHAAMENAFSLAASGLDTPSGMMFYNDQPPEMIFYQGIALQKLGRSVEAQQRFTTLIDYGKSHMGDTIKIDYFAVSLPDFFIFDGDLQLKNRLHCLFMCGLGYLGQGEHQRARQQLEEALALDKNHLGVVMHLRMVP